jgi:hypothetical protein
MRRAYNERFAATFMNVEEAASKARNQLEHDLRNALFKYLPLAALFLTLLTFFLNYGVLSIASRAMPMDVVDDRAKALVREYRQQLDDLQKKVEALEKQRK